MPWHLEARGGQYCVVKDGDTDPIPGGCHPTEAEAQTHMAALYANEPAAQGAAATLPGATPCGCGETDPNHWSAWTDEHPYAPRAAAATEPLDAPFPVPAYPPREWFTDRPDWLIPGLDLHVDDDGRVAGYFYEQGQCLVHDAAACPLPSPTGYAAFHQQHVVCADGIDLACGVIGNVNGHASEYARPDVAQAHYADPDRQIVACRAYDDDYGGFILGAVVPGRTYGDVALARRCSLSGDWRPMPAQWWVANGITAAVARQHDFFDCIGPTLVTRPGLPLVRRYAAAILGGLGGVQLPEEEQMTQTAENPGVVVHQHFGPQGPPPIPVGPQPILGAGGQTGTNSATWTAASPAPPQAPSQAPPSDGAQPAGPDEMMAALQRLAAAISDLNDRVGALEEQAQAAVAAAVQAALDAVPEWPEAEETPDPLPPRAAAPSGKAAPSDAASRNRMAESGVAMPDGSFPIQNRAQLQDAVQGLGRASNPDAVKRHIVKRARALGALAWLKEHTSWYTGPTT